MSSQVPRWILIRAAGLQILLLLTVVAVLGWGIHHLYSQKYMERTTVRMQESLGLLDSEIGANPGESWCRHFKTSSSQRLTLISEEGKVICDSSFAADRMDNHLARPELRQSLTQNFGFDFRRSQTLGTAMIYGAKHTAWGWIRLASSISEMDEALRLMDRWIGLFGIAFVLFFGALSAWISARSLRPLGRLLVVAQEAQSHVTDRRFRLETASWKDLERVIDQMREALLSRNESLSREREELRVLMGSISDSIVAVDTHRIPLFFNARFSLLVAHPKSLDQREKTIDAYFADASLGSAFERALEAGQDSTVPALRLPLSGELGHRYFTVSISPLRDPTGRIYGAVGIFHDVTELKVAEQMRIDFVANVSHELRTPLTSIKGYADTLIGDVRMGASPDLKFLEIIERNVGRLMSLISDLLDLSWLESGESLHLEKVELREVTEKVLAQVREKTNKRRQAIRCEFGADFLTADSARIEQVMINLIENASKYTPEGSEITIRWSQKEGAVFLSVQDNGPGIPAEHLPRLFERFYRVDKARSREQGGTGLGLAIVKHIVQRHGGSVAVQSEPQKGTEFICRFPKK